VTAQHRCPSVARAVAALGFVVGLGVAASAGLATPAGAAGGGATPAFSQAPAVAALPGVVVYLANPDNYAAGSRQTLILSTLTGRQRTTLLSATNTTIGLVCFSPDGSHLAYFRATESGAAIDVMDVATKRVTSPFKLGKKAGFITGLAWSADGTDLIVGSTEPPQAKTTHAESALWQVPATGGTATRLTPYEDAGSPAVAPDGDVVYVVSKTFSSTTTYKKSTLWVANPDGSDPKQIASSSHFIAGPSVSPNGQTIAFSVTVDVITSHLEAIGVAGGSVSNLTKPVSGRSDLLPSWSPDGTHLLFLSSRAGRYDANKDNQLLDAYVMSVFGTDVTKVISYSGTKGSLDVAAWGAAPAAGA
jgi:Tol biopolymer transport system component